MDRVAVPPDAVPNNLPHHLTTFVGREADLRSLKTLLPNARMVTLVGTGGAGKSRLATELARATMDRWPDGVWWVDLSAAADTGEAVVGALELPGQGSTESVAASWLAARRALLILDSCEHLIGNSATFGQALLERCPQLTILATSREPLGVAGEVRWPVTSLVDPDALHLFEARARLVSPNFKVSSGNIQPVTEICDRLDRLPLAIEMAAARLDVMSERELLANLTDRFRFLASGARTAPERQQTMTAAIDWSHRLLTEDESRLFRRLAVFQGGFTLEAAQRVCSEGDAPGVMKVLGGLVQKSMVVADKLDDGSTRYRLMESHHAYAREKLTASADLQLTQRLHYEYFARWLRPPAVQKGKSRESANLWVALDWAKTNAADRGLGLAVELADFEFSDHARTKDVLLDLVERSPATGALRARALNLAGRLVLRQGDLDLSRSLADSSLTLGRQLGDPELIAYLVRGAGTIYHSRGELDVAAAMYDEALSLVGDHANEALLVEVKNALGVLAVERGQHAEALELLTQCVASRRRAGDQASLARCLESLANAQLGLGDLDGAASSWSESLSMFSELSDPFGTIWCLGGLALVAAKHGDDERTVRLASVADRMSREWSLSTGSFRLDQLADVIEQARSKLGARRGDAAWNDGQAMSTTRALEYARGEETSAQLADAGLLTRRELEVVALVAAGLTNKQIAERLFLSERTAEGHVERIRNKLGVRSRTDVATWAVTKGIGTRNLDKTTPTSTV
ncbi:MAG: tetratricopeptide repeat protein [Chloroflexi bacterium]|nr:MAG: tetratricopeptide repeat protein [Chloroflexota bacterium]